MRWEERGKEDDDATKWVEDGGNEKNMEEENDAAG